ncbi:MAG: DUF805 domain-containing protein [Sphingomonas sp.]
MRWMILPLKRYFDFTGRSRRKEFWAFFFLPFAAVLGVAIGLAKVLIAIGAAGASSEHAVSDVAAYLGPALGWLFIVIAALFIPSIAVQVRRFHDQGLTGALVLLNFVPVIGTFVVLILMCLPGTDGDNRYGPDPRQAG